MKDIVSHILFHFLMFKREVNKTTRHKSDTTSFEISNLDDNRSVSNLLNWAILFGKK